MSINIKTPYSRLTELDKDIFDSVGSLLIDIGKYLIENGPFLEEIPIGPNVSSYQIRPVFSEMYDSLLNVIRLTEQEKSIDNVEKLYVAINNYEYSYDIDEVLTCRVNGAFKSICRDAHDLMYGGELDEETTYLIEECDWEELDAIVYTYIEYLQNYILYKSYI